MHRFFQLDRFQFRFLESEICKTVKSEQSQPVSCGEDYVMKH